jgi:hypothetical protein
MIIPRGGRDGRRLIGGGLLLRRTPRCLFLCSSACVSEPPLRDDRSAPAQSLQPTFMARERAVRLALDSRPAGAVPVAGSGPALPRHSWATA